MLIKIATIIILISISLHTVILIKLFNAKGRLKVKDNEK